MSAGLWSSTRSRPPVSSTRSGSCGRPAQLILVPAPRTRRGCPRLPRSTSSRPRRRWWAPVRHRRHLPARPRMVRRRSSSRRASPSEPSDHAGFLERVRPPRARDLTAQPRGGQHLARVGHACRGRTRSAPAPSCRGRLGEHLRHRARLVDADAVLAGDRAAVLDAELEDRGATFSACSASPATALSKSTSGCRLPSPAWKTLATRSPAAPDISAMRLEHLGQSGPRDDAVLDEVVRADPTDRGERRLAALPDQRPLGRVRAIRMSNAPVVPTVRSTRSNSASTSTAAPSSSTTSAAAAPTG